MQSCIIALPAIECISVLLYLQGLVMNPRHFFPLGKAYGEAFCNRIEETNKLIGHMKSGKHTFLVAPRRYGKSSLCERALDLAGLPWGKMDFHIAVGHKDVERIIINGVTDLIGASIGSIEQLIHVIKKCTKKLNPKLGIGAKKVLYLELEVIAGNSSAENISDALLLIEKLLRKKERQSVLLFDEFQEIGALDEGKSIEGAIRHAAQETQNLSFIFSGSNPHLLKNMFEDERRPLYKLCRKLTLERIGKNDYLAHLNKAAKAIWKQELDEEVFEQIMTVTEQHPYYVNYLCDELWSEESKAPNIDAVNAAWSMTVEEERSDLLKDFFTLSENQRKLLIYMANSSGKDIYSSNASKKMNIHITSIARALTTLVEKDYLEKTEGGYRLIVPAYRQLLQLQ